MNALQVLREQIAYYLLEVRADGTIWKLARRDRSQHVTPITPKRAELKSKAGYLMVKMEWMGQQYLISAHIAAFEILCGPIPPKMDINHLDGVKTNNSPENMELATRSENHLHAYKTKLRMRPKSLRPPISENVLNEARALRATRMTYLAIAEKMGISQTSAFRAVKK